VRDIQGLEQAIVHLDLERARGVDDLLLAPEYGAAAKKGARLLDQPAVIGL
jgi:hypothetical protein